MDTVAHFWSLSRIDTKHLPEPPPRADDSAIVITDPTPVLAQYRPVGHEDEASLLTGSFDGVMGTFVCTKDTVTELCQIGAVRTDKDDGGTVVDGVEYSFVAADTWKFVADNPAALVATKRQDGDYLVMGWWLETAVVSTGDFKFGRFFAGSDPYGDHHRCRGLPGEDATFPRNTRAPQSASMPSGTRAPILPGRACLGPPPLWKPPSKARRRYDQGYDRGLCG